MTMSEFGLAKNVAGAGKKNEKAVKAAMAKAAKRNGGVVPDNFDPSVCSTNYFDGVGFMVHTPASNHQRTWREASTGITGGIDWSSFPGDTPVPGSDHTKRRSMHI